MAGSQAKETVTTTKARGEEEAEAEAVMKAKGSTRQDQKGAISMGETPATSRREAGRMAMATIEVGWLSGGSSRE
jgi:hypothetical protein